MQSLILKPIKDFPNYFAGSDGNIYSKNYLFKTQAEIPRRLKIGRTRKNSYQVVCLKRQGGQFSRKVHILICTAFHGERPSGLECSHLDDDKDNNRPENLVWESHKDNMERSFKNGKSCHGCEMHNSSFTKEEFLEVKKLLAIGMRHIDIAIKFNCDRTVITKINTGERYKRFVFDCNQDGREF